MPRAMTSDDDASTVPARLRPRARVSTATGRIKSPPAWAHHRHRTPHSHLCARRPRARAMRRSRNHPCAFSCVVIARRRSRSRVARVTQCGVSIHISDTRQRVEFKKPNARHVVTSPRDASADDARGHATATEYIFPRATAPLARAFERVRRGNSRARARERLNSRVVEDHHVLRDAPTLGARLGDARARE